ncbi:universal stress protein [Siminovitchia terrae]|uniref:Universal stress protein n=1 Tax=Siminovitchia terrae TaxID=1914933 RepID=A0A429X1C2_SIMTE|nr:universal stress protein [Siminovitchia terrae]RST57008.1 universal stress protein [Siminovitchia terrae]GIN94053.1 universal stress protein [Siminovitchia terrae]
MYKRLLVAADGSKNSIRAAEEAAKLARLAEGAVVEIIYVMDYSKSKGEVLQSRDGEMLEAERRKKLVPVEDVFVKSEVPYKVTILNGDPGPAIVEYVNKSSCDMLVIGSRGLNTLQEMVLGSVSHKVAKRVESPVLIVK